MNKLRLIQYRDLKREISHLEKRIEKLNSVSVVSDTVSASNSEFPYQAVTINIEGIPHNKEAIRRIKGILDDRYEKCCSLKVELEEFISGIFDSRVRLVFEHRYIDGWSWQRIALKLGSHNEATARSMHDRYLDKYSRV